MRLLLATRSADKAREIRALLPAGIVLLDLDAADIPAHPDEEEIERYETFAENAVAKARYFHARSGLPAIADDSGIAVDALGGAPGVRSKRFAARAGLGGSELDRANNELLLQRLASVSPEHRTAHYACAAALVFDSQPAYVALGTCPGRILETPRGAGGFGYDPVFAPEGFERSFGEISAAEKNSLSHRGRAFRALTVWISALHRELTARSGIR